MRFDIFSFPYYTDGRAVNEYSAILGDSIKVMQLALNQFNKGQYLVAQPAGFNVLTA